MSRIAFLPVLLITALVGFAPASQAVAAYDTQTSLSISQPVGTYGFAFHATGDVGPGAGAPTDKKPTGTVKLERLLGGTSEWAEVGEAHTVGDWSISTSYIGNAEYRLHYTGGTYSTDPILWNPSYSNVVSVTTQRGSEAATQKVKKHRRFFLQGTAVGWTNRKVTIMEKERCKGCRWHKLRKVRTDASGHYKTRVPASSRGIVHRVKIPASARFPAYTSRKYVAIDVATRF